MEKYFLSVSGEFFSRKNSVADFRISPVGSGLKTINCCLIGQNIQVKILFSIATLLLVLHRISKVDFSDLIQKVKIIDWLHTDLFQVFISSKENPEFSDSEN